MMAFQRSSKEAWKFFQRFSQSDLGTLGFFACCLFHLPVRATLALRFVTMRASYQLLPAATSCYQLLALAQCNIHNIQTAYSNLNSNIHIVTLVWSYLLWWIRDTRDTDHPGHPKVPRAAKDSTGSPTW